MPHTYILASKSILSACKYIPVPLLLNKEQTSKVLEKTSQADPTSILSFIVSFLGKGIPLKRVKDMYANQPFGVGEQLDKRMEAHSIQQLHF